MIVFLFSILYSALVGSFSSARLADASARARFPARTEYAVSPTADSTECAKPKSAWIWCDDFEIDRLDRYFEYSRADGRFARVQGGGVAGSFGMRAQFRKGETGAGYLHVAFGKTPQRYFRPVDAGTSTYRDIYWRVFVRYDSGWVGGGGFKLSRATSFVASSGWAQAMIAHVWSGKTRINHLAIDPASGTDSAGVVRTKTYNDFARFRWLGSRSGVTPVFHPSHNGRWHCIEARARLNDRGAANGLVELWIDDQPEAQRRNLNFVGGMTEYGINAVFLENYWNGGAPRQQARYFDRFIVSTQRIGCDDK
ncbi:MAG: hypothetical protein H7Z74_11905 [Anaerolineae bacterium]|nr:hypothetical protein [Gemmatimonadaceae bacterium]